MFRDIGRWWGSGKWTKLIFITVILGNVVFRRGDREGECCGGGEVVEVEKWAKLTFITII